jgi:hypothetical protein
MVSENRTIAAKKTASQPANQSGPKPKILRAERVISTRSI